MMKRKVVRLTESDIQRIALGAANKILNEANYMDSIDSDINELTQIYEKADELERFVETTAFENSPIIQYTSAIKKYCIEQKNNILG